jgi:hypothetical protein
MTSSPDGPIARVEPEVTFMLDRVAPFFGGASGDATIDDAFGVGFDFITHRVEAALGPTAVPAKEIPGKIRLGWFLGHVRTLSVPIGDPLSAG